jgi:hypothetical protein
MVLSEETYRTHPMPKVGLSLSEGGSLLFDDADFARHRIIDQLGSVRRRRDLGKKFLLDQFVKVFWIPALLDVEQLYRLIDGSGIDGFDGALLGFANGAKVIDRSSQRITTGAVSGSGAARRAAFLTAANEDRRGQRTKQRKGFHGFSVAIATAESKRGKKEPGTKPRARREIFPNSFGNKRLFIRGGRSVC